MQCAYEIQIYGLVQGVGFRPFVYQQAEKYGLSGWIKNKGGAVSIHVEGAKDQTKAFILAVLKDPPTLAKIQEVKIQKGEILHDLKFVIKTSSDQLSTRRFLPTDIGICDSCLQEIKEPSSKRYQYAFTNCTSCGPRYTILKALPYDRQLTTMSPFMLCISCKEEYEDPRRRRFHAQPNCCLSCGPELFLCDSEGESIACKDPIKKTKELLHQGFIIAIKGLGGFHLCCDARNEGAVMQLRKRKERPHKPFAIMARDMDTIKEICEVTVEEETLLKSSKKPIVLLSKKKADLLPADVAPRIGKIGVMLPYTPLHFLLFDKGIIYLVMTSGNAHHQPICFTNDDALNKLFNVADYFLMHNREIYNPIDDSVVKVVDHKEQVSRLARGYAPRYFKETEYGIEKEILGVGSEQKNTFTMLHNGYLHTSPYIGDLNEVNTYRLYRKLIQYFQKILQFTPDIIAHDYHPDYTSTHYAKGQNVRQIPVQHHHAHMVSCMAEHRLEETVIGVIYDGTGYGLDSAVWGGEFFVGTRSEFQRVGHLQYVTLQGSALVIREIWRSAVGFLWSIGIDASPVVHEIDPKRIFQIQKAIDANINCFRTSSIGRLFDCVAALLGLQTEITYDGQGAIELEAVQDENVKEAYAFEIDDEVLCFHIRYELVLRGILEDLDNNTAVPVIATKFHNTIIQFTLAGVRKIADKYSLKDVVLSGGVFENDYLLDHLVLELEDAGFQVFHNEQIPINDSGISFGQASVAAAKLVKEATNVLSDSR